MNQKQKLFGSAVLLYGLHVVTLVLSFVRSALFANYFGAGWEADAYNIAIKIPTVLFATISVAIKTVTIPLYTKRLQEGGKQGASRFYSNLLTIVLIISAVLSGLCIVFRRQAVFLFAPGLDEQTAVLAEELLKYFSITLAMIAVVDVQSGVLNVHKEFGRPKIFAEIVLVVRIVVLVLLAGAWGLTAAIFGFVAGNLVSVVLSTIETNKKVKYSPVVDLKDPDIIAAGKRSIPVFFGVGLAEINRIVDGIAASFMDTGSISCLGYASTLTTSITSLFVNSFATIAYPLMSEYAAKEDTKGLAQSFVFIISVLMYMTIPVFFGGVLLNEEIVSVIYMRGAFSETAMQLTAVLFSIYSIRVIFSGIRLLGVRLLYSLGDTKTATINSSIGISVNIVLNILLGIWMGVRGLAYATSISMIVIALLILRSIKKRLPEIRFREFLVASLKALFTTFVMIVAVYFCRQMLSLSPFWSLLICVCVGILVYLITLLLLRPKEVKRFMNMVRPNKKRPSLQKAAENGTREKDT